MMDDPAEDESPFLLDEPPFHLDQACVSCHGTGVMEGTRGLVECTCLLQQRVAHYLTPQYGPSINWDTNFPAESYRGANVLIANTTQLRVAQFRQQAFALVKSFLLLMDRRLSHQTLRPYEIFRYLFGAKDAVDVDKLTIQTQLLILVLNGDDPPRTAYATDIPWLIGTRQDHGVATWIISAIPPEDPLFEKRYQGLRAPLLDSMSSSFVTLPLPPVAPR